MNLTPVEAQGAGFGLLISSDVVTPPVGSNVNYGIGTVDPNVAVATIGADGKVCYANSKHTNVHLVADHLGTIPAAGYTPATTSGAPDRKVDTRESSSNPIDYGEQYLSVDEPLDCANIAEKTRWMRFGADGVFYSDEWPTLRDGLTTASAVVGAAYVRHRAIGVAVMARIHPVGDRWPRGRTGIECEC